MTKPLASLSIDLDNLWTYMMIHGDSGWSDYPSYLPLAVPRILEVFAEHDLRATWFLVGQDASTRENHDLFQEIVRSGHEVGNHSFAHDPWLHHYTRERIYEDVARAHENIETATGRKPVGFRGPGYSWTPTLIDVLGELGYRYDASSLPTFIGPLARWYYFRTTHLDEEARKLRARLFGRFSDGFRPNKPYVWRRFDGSPVVEIPVTTIPIVRTPFHFSYLLYLSAYSNALMLAYLRTALFFCRRTNTRPSMLLHPLDFLDARIVPELEFFPAMRTPSERKIEAFDLVIGELKRHYTIGTMRDHSEEVAGRWHQGQAPTQDVILPIPVKQEGVR